LFKQGDEGDALYLITAGSLGVFVRKEGDTEGDGTRVDGIVQGQVVGEMALLGGGVRNATILAESDVEGIKIDREDFEHLIKESPGMRAAVEELKRERVLKTMQREASSMNSSEWAKLATQSIRTMSASEIHDVLAEHGGGSPLAIWMGNILDAIPGSLVIGATFLGMASFNPTLLVAIFLANLPEAMASALTMRQAGYSNAKIYGLWGSLVILGPVFAAIGNIYLPAAPIELLALFEAIAGGAILALVAQVMFPHAFEEGGDVVSISTIAGFMVAFFLTALDIQK
jgi:CRP-like cAMP-binding protein